MVVEDFSILRGHGLQSKRGGAQWRSIRAAVAGHPVMLGLASETTEQ